jgi:hypothetical protein
VNVCVGSFTTSSAFCLICAYNHHSARLTSQGSGVDGIFVGVAGCIQEIVGIVDNMRQIYSDPVLWLTIARRR